MANVLGKARTKTASNNNMEMELIEVNVGFSNERSAEYMILNNLYEKIKNEYRLFYPFYYKKNRDDR